MLPLIGTAGAIALQQVMKSLVLRVLRGFRPRARHLNRPRLGTMEPPIAHKVLIDGNCTFADELQPSKLTSVKS